MSERNPNFRRRRRVLKQSGLAALAAGLAGCSAITGGDSENDDTGDDDDATGSDSVIVGSQTFTEQLNLGYFAYHLLNENTDREVIDNTNYGNNSDMAEVYEAEDPGFHVYYEYMGSAWASQPPVNEEQITDPDELHAALEEQLQDRPVQITDRTNWQNTWAPFGKAAVLEEYGFSSLSDLADYVNAGNYDVTFALEASYFGRSDGFEALVDHYGFEEEHVQAWQDAGGIFRLGSGAVTGTAVDQDKADIGLGYSTSAWIADIEGDVQVLEDDEGFWPAFHVVGIVREAVASDAVLTELNKLPEIVPDASTMRELNGYAGEVGPRTATREYLSSEGYI